MPICNLDDNKDLANAIANYINGEIIDNLNPEINKTGEPFKLVQVMKDIYAISFAKNKDMNQALGVAGAVPQMFLKVLTLKPNYITDLDYDNKAIKTLIKEMDAAEDPINVIADKLKIGKKASVETIAQNKVAQEEKEHTLPKGSRAYDAYTVGRLSSLSLLNPTGQSQLTQKVMVDGKEVEKPIVNESDRTKAFAYKALRGLLTAQDKERTLTTVTYTKHKGFKLKAMFENNLPEGKAYPGLTPSSRKITAIVDNTGKYVYFDKTGKVTTEDKGEIAYFFIKNNDPRNIKFLLDKKMAIATPKIMEEAKGNDALFKKLLAQERERFQKELQAESNQLDAITAKLIKGEEVLLNITGGKKGIVDDTDRIPDAKVKKESEKTLDKFKLSPTEKESLTFSWFERQGKMQHLPAIKLDDYDSYISLKGSLIATTNKGLFNTLVEVLINDNLTNPDGTKVTPIERVNFFNQFTKPSGLVVSPLDNTISLQIKGKDLTEEELKDFLADNMYFTIMSSTKIQRGLYNNFTISNNVVNVTKDNYYDFISKYVIPRMPWDKTSEGVPMVNNGYFSFEPTDITQQVEEKAQKVLTKVQKVVGPKKDPGKGISDLLDRSKLIESRATPEQKARAEEWIKNTPILKEKNSVGGKLIPLHLLRNVTNSDAWATWSKAGITLYEGSDYTHAYHEAWHAFSQVYLTYGDRTKLYDGVSRFDGSFTVVRNIEGPGGIVNQKVVKVKFDEATRKELEEFTAEEYRIYSMNGGKFKVADEKTSVFKSIFSRIWNFLKGLFKGTSGVELFSNPGSEGVLSEMFNALYNAKTAEDLNMFMPSIENAEFGTLATGAMSESKGFNLAPTQKQLLVKSIDGIISNATTSAIVDYGKYGAATKILQGKERLTHLYNVTIKETLVERLAELVDEFEAKKDSLNTIQKDYHENLINTLRVGVEFFGEAGNVLTSKTNTDSLIAFHLQNSAFSGIIRKDVAEPVDNEDPEYKKYLGQHDKTANEVESSKLATPNAEYLLRSLLKQEMVDGERVNKLNELGFPETIEYKPFWNVLIEKVGGEQNIQALYERLLEVQDLDPRFAQLLDKLGDPNVVAYASPEAADIWLGMTRSLNLYKEPLVTSTFTKEKDEKGGTKLVVRTGKVSSDFFPIKNKIWPSLFSAQTGDFVINRDNKPNILDLDAVVNAFLVKKLDNENAYRYFVKNPSLEIAFLNAVGLYVSDNFDVKANLNSKDVNYIADVIGHAALNQKGEETANPIEFLNSKHKMMGEVLQNGKVVSRKIETASQSGVVDRLAQLEADYSTEYGSQMKKVPDGGTKTVNNRNSSLTRIAYAINKAKHRDDFHDEDGDLNYVPHLDVMSNPAVMGSVMLNTVFNAVGSKIADDGVLRSIDLFDLPGIQYTDADGTVKGVSHGAMSNQDKYVADIVGMLQGGYIEAIRHGEKSTYTAVRASRLDTYIGKLNNHQYIDTAAWLKNKEGNYLLGIDPFKELNKIMMPKLEGELRRIKMIKNGIPGNKNYYKENIKGFEGGEKFDYFDGILQSKTAGSSIKDKLIDEYVDKLDSTTSLATLLNSDVAFKILIENTIIEYFTALKERSAVQDYNKIFGDVVPEFLQEIATMGLKPEQIDKIGKAANLKEAMSGPFANNIKDALLFSFVVNTSIHAQEVALLELGDGFQFDHTKDESTKRVPTYNSSGIIFPTDQISIDIIKNYYDHNSYEQYLIDNNDPLFEGKTAKPFTKRYNKAIIRESKVRSVKYNDYAEMFKHNLDKMGYKGERLRIALYGDVDAKGVKGTHAKPVGGFMKSYAEIKDGDGQGWITFDFYRKLKVLENSWSPEQENGFQKIIRGEQLSAAQLLEYFPVYKLQYAGPLVTERGRYPIQSIDKFALMPLIPTFVEGTPLETIHKEMMAQDIGYALFESGSKRSHIKANKDTSGDDIYEGNDTSRLKSGFKFEPNPSYLEYLKNQTEVNSSFKGSGTLSTQLRKVFNVGLYENGKPITKRAGENTEKVFKTLKRLTNEMKRQLLKEIGWTEADVKSKKTTPEKMIAMIDFIVRDMKRQGYSDHEIKFIEEDKKNDEIDLSLSPAAAKLEKFLMAIVNNRLVKLKLNGEPLVQFSSAFTQKFRKPTDEETALYNDFGTNGLESYVVSKDGTVDTKGVKVKIALSENYEGLLKTRFFVDGKATEDTVGVYDRKGKKWVLNTKASLDRLNQMLKNEAWLNSDNNREKLLITGVRIPTQGPNSVEFAQVHEFLPAAAGPIIIIPAEIVAKSGGDFDVDKLTMYMKTITKQGTLVEDKYDTPEELEPLIKAAEKKIEGLKASKLMINENLDDFRETLTTESKHKKMSKQQFFDLTTNDNEALLKTLSDPAQRIFLKELYPESYAVYTKSIKDFKVEEYDEVENQITDLFGKNSAVSKAYAELADLKFQKRKFASGIQNTLIDDIINVMKLPEMAFALMQPNDTHLAKPIADKLKDVVMKADKEANFENYTSTGEKSPGKGVSSTSLYEYDYNKKKQQDNLNGKNILGTISLGNTFSNVMNMAGASMEASYKTTIQVPDPSSATGTKEIQVDVPLKLAFNHRKNADGTISLSSLVDIEDNNRIADILTQLMNGAVDVGKDAWIAYLQGNMQAIPKILFLLQAGMPLDDVAYFVTNPLIREYIKVQQSAGSTLSKLINNGQSGITVTTTWLNKVLTPATKGRQDLSLRFTKDKSLKTFNTWAIYELLKEYGNKVGKRAFSKEGLEATANASLNYTDDAQLAGLLHYVYLERITEDYENLKKAINVDTNTTADTYSAQAKVEEVERARSMNTINKKIMKYVEQEGPIAPFFIQEFSRELFGRLFALRDNERVNKFLLNLTGDTFKSIGIRKSTGYDTETLIPKFKNALAQYIFANTLKKDAVNAKGEIVPVREGTKYKGREISDLINIDEVTNDYKNKRFVNGVKGANTYLDRKLHPLPEMTFTDLEEFVEFNLEREYLRKAIMPATILLSESIEFKQALDTLKNSGSEVFQKQADEDDAKYTKRMNRAAYESMLADTALMNIYNNWSLFRSGNNTVAKKLMNIIENYPDLRLQFSLVEQFTLVSTDLPGKRTGRRNFKIKGYADLEAPLIDEYSNQWQNLADPTVPKVVASEGGMSLEQAAAANAYISEFFAQLPMFAFLQSGMDAGEFSMTAIMPTDRYKPIMIKAAKNFSKVLQRDDAPVILEGFKHLFETNNAIATRKLRGRGLEWKRSLSELLKDGLKNVTSVYADPFITKINDKIYVLNDSYSENGATVNLTVDHVKKLKADNPGFKFILTDEDLGINFSNILSPEELESAKTDLDSFMNMIHEQDIPVVITGKGFGPVAKKASIEEVPVSNIAAMSELTNHSGGAYGGDTFWDMIGREFGVTKHMHYKDAGNANLSQKLRNAKVTATILTKEQMDKARIEVERLLGEKYPDTLQGNLQVRNYYQVANADAVFAVAEIDASTRPGVFGGTNTAVQLGIKMGKPVYVFDLDTKKWYTQDVEFLKTGYDKTKHEWNYNGWKEIDTPTLTKNFAGVGSRDIENYNVQKEGKWVPREKYKGIEVEEAAKQAIREVYAKTAKSLSTTSTQPSTQVQSTINKEQLGISNVKKIILPGGESSASDLFISFDFKEREFNIYPVKDSKGVGYIRLGIKQPDGGIKPTDPKTGKLLDWNRAKVDEFVKEHLPIEFVELLKSYGGLSKERKQLIEYYISELPLRGGLESEFYSPVTPEEIRKKFEKTATNEEKSLIKYLELGRMDYLLGMKKRLSSNRDIAKSDTTKQKLDILIDDINKVLSKSTTSTQPSTQVQPVETHKYKYYGAVYDIVRDASGKGIDVAGYKGKAAAKAKLLEAYNTNPNMDPQTGIYFKSGPLVKTEEKAEEIAPKLRTGKGILEARATPIDYTPGQKKALTDIETLINANKQSNYLLAGYAGTGKTTIAENIARFARTAGRDVSVIAPTNKAAKVLNDKLKQAGVRTEAQTIHKAIYGEPDANGEWVKSAKIKNSMIIVDESSMIDKVVMKDLIDVLKDKNNIVVFMGDGFQLEQIGEDSGLFGSLNDPSIFKKNYGVPLNGSTMLTEVRRQSLDSNILKVATITRLEDKVYIPENSLPDFKISKTRAEFNRDFQDSIKNKEDSVAIVATNAERMLMNTLARAARYTPEQQKKQMNDGEVLMSIANSVLYPNAETFKVSNVIEETKFDIEVTQGKGDYAKDVSYPAFFTKVITAGGDEAMIANIPTYDKPSLYHAQLLAAARKNQELYNFLDENELLVATKKGVKVSPALVIATFGYAITGHKSQGSQWDKVFVHQNYVAPTWNPARWYYTAITRAAKDIVLLPAGKNTRINEAQLNEKINASVTEETTNTPQSTTPKPGKNPSLDGEFSLYLSDKLKDNLDYDNPGSGAPSVDELLTGAPVITKEDIENKKLEC